MWTYALLAGGGGCSSDKEFKQTTVTDGPTASKLFFDIFNFTVGTGFMYLINRYCACSFFFQLFYLHFFTGKS